ncbi:PREDICTED: trithorax group protein osa-like [Priapulus caudatus]|uniref:Trithorax group protein osa-like n=1 Tax=Priapulus caudatus TaxID=37621 RepID=A0ABM1DWP6_PRICU|nr:PREDICTED: trithorax group protein osa-like [Priapulus caudatus]
MARELGSCLLLILMTGAAVSQDFKTAAVCEGSTQIIACWSDEMMLVEHAYYDAIIRPGNACHSNQGSSNCVNDITEPVRKKCSGYASCVLKLPSLPFPNTCGPGSSITVVYACVLARSIDRTCAHTTLSRKLNYVQSAGYPIRYRPNSDCKWVVRNAQEERMRVTLYDLHLETKDTSNQCQDYVKIEKKDSRDQVMLCGAHKHFIVETKAKDVEIAFHSDREGTYGRGFFLGVEVGVRESVIPLWLRNGDGGWVTWNGATDDHRTAGLGGHLIAVIILVPLFIILLCICCICLLCCYKKRRERKKKSPQEKDNEKEDDDTGEKKLPTSQDEFSPRDNDGDEPRGPDHGTDGEPTMRKKKPRGHPPDGEEPGRGRRSAPSAPPDDQYPQDPHRVSESPRGQRPPVMRPGFRLPPGYPHDPDPRGRPLDPDDRPQEQTPRGDLPRRRPPHDDDGEPTSPDQEAPPAYDLATPPAGYPGGPVFPGRGPDHAPVKSPRERLPEYDLGTPPAGYPGGPTYPGGPWQPERDAPQGQAPVKSPRERLPEYDLATPPAGYPGGPGYPGGDPPRGHDPIRSPRENVPAYDLATPPAGYPGGPGYLEPPSQFPWPAGEPGTHREPLKEEPRDPKRYPDSPDPFADERGPPHRAPHHRRSPRTPTPPVSPKMRYRARPPPGGPFYDNPLFPGESLPDEIPPRFLSGPPQTSRSEPDLLDDDSGPNIWSCGSQCFSFPDNLDDAGRGDDDDGHFTPGGHSHGRPSGHSHGRPSGHSHGRPSGHSHARPGHTRSLPRESTELSHRGVDPIPSFSGGPARQGRKDTEV